MSNAERCLQEPELVSLLDGAAPAELQDHVGGCVHCQAELALLRQGFAELGDAPGDRDELALQRIATHVMPQILADLAGAQKRPARGWRQLLGPGAMATLAVIPAALLWVKRGDALLQPGRALGLALLPLFLLPALAGSLRLRRVALGLASALTVGLLLSTVAGVEVDLLQGSGCLMLGLTGCLLPALVIVRAAGPERFGMLSGALLGAAIGSEGAALQRLSCGIGGVPHALVFHLGPFFLLMALGGFWYSRAARDAALSR